jgi:hypothetical protein
MAPALCCIKVHVYVCVHVRALQLVDDDVLLAVPTAMEVELLPTIDTQWRMVCDSHVDFVHDKE